MHRDRPSCGSRYRIHVLVAPPHGKTILLPKNALLPYAAATAAATLLAAACAVAAGVSPLQVGAPLGWHPCGWR
ncbi:hypothetical protein C4D60_Mb02t03540 [Musa balbisiana]|uniref:Uncharacterized protein n=1 Tax=Musa balbisiana TaxID=52838 RepID=A0A4S8I9D6_MUSBA|nr:hypothetical protein C4D60_Mb02t03540 [Musa balbisiana]